MAARINDDIRAEWDAIDNLSPSPRKRTTLSRKPGLRPSVSPRKEYASPRRVIRKIERQVGYPSQRTGSTQECITLEPVGSPILQKSPKSVVDRAPRYSKLLPVKQATQQLAVQDSEGTSSENEDQESANSQENIVEDSSDDLDDSEDDNPQAMLPPDSDEEEIRQRRRQRREHFPDHHSELLKAGPERQLIEEDYAGRNVIDLISSVQQDSLLTSTSRSQTDPSPSQQKNRSPLGHLKAPIPVSSSTDLSQDSAGRRQVDVQVQRTQFSLSSVPIPDQHLVEIPTTLDSLDYISTGLMPQSATQLSRQDIGVQQISTQNHKSQSASPSRKRRRSSLEQERAPHTTPRKKLRLDDRQSFVSQHVKAAPSFSGTQLAYQESSPRQASSQAGPAIATPSRIVQRSIPSTPQNSARKPQTASVVHTPSGTTKRSVPSTPQSSTRKPLLAVQPLAVPSQSSPVKAAKREKVLRSPLTFSVDHELPRVSASQPNPTRPRIKKPDMIQTIEEETTTEPDSNDEAEEAEEAQDPALDAEGSPNASQHLNLEPLRKIQNLRGEEYCTTIKSDVIYSGLLQLFIDFASQHRSYLGSLNHLFTMCNWLMDDRNQGKIEEGHWDDFILRHKQGEYTAYVTRCLAKEKEVGSWDKWYQQASPRKMEGCVASAERLTRVLMGREGRDVGARRPAVPESFSRFRRDAKGLAVEVRA